MKNSKTTNSRGAGALRAAAMAAACLMLEGCGPGEWFGPEIPPPAPMQATDVDTAAYGKLGYRFEWIGYGVIPPGGRPTECDVFADAVAFEETGGTVTLLNAATGQMRWQTVVGQENDLYMGNVRQGSRLMCSTRTDLYILDMESGGLVSHQKFERVVNTKPVLFDDQLIFGTAAGEIYSHRVSSGIMMWAYKLPVPKPGRFDVDPVMIGDFDVGLVSSTGEVVLIDPRSASATGRAKIYDGPGDVLAASRDQLFVSSLDQSIYAFNRLGAQMRWRVPTEAPLMTGPVYADGKLYAAVPGGLMALSVADGHKLWLAPGVDGHVIGVRQGKLIAWDGKEAVTIDMANGDVLERVSLPGLFSLQTDAFTDGHLYATTNRGEVLRFLPR